MRFRKKFNNNKINHHFMFYNNFNLNRLCFFEAKAFHLIDKAFIRIVFKYFSIEDLPSILMVRSLLKFRP